MVHDLQFPRWGAGFGFARGAGAPGGPPRGPRVDLASAQRDVTGSLSLVTKEGDTVTLSASFDASVTYAGLRRGRGEGGVFVASAQTSSNLSLQVQGNLNSQELADIQRAVRTFMHDLRAMMQGRNPSIANVVRGDATTLQSISASTTTEQTLTLVSATRPGALPVPATPALDDDADGDANPARLTAEDADLAPTPGANLFPARGTVSPLPVSQPIISAWATPA